MKTLETSHPLSIIEVSWLDQTARDRLSSIRRQVFIDEQQVPEALEWDEDDANARHFLVWQDEQPIATARLIIDGLQQQAKIGRMAVLKNKRGQGIGTALLRHLIAFCHEQGMTSISLSAQCQAIGFYQKQGFQPEGEVYLDAGIDHRDMQFRLN